MNENHSERRLKIHKRIHPPCITSKLLNTNELEQLFM